MPEKFQYSAISESRLIFYTDKEIDITITSDTVEFDECKERFEKHMPKARRKIAQVIYNVLESHDPRVFDGPEISKELLTCKGEPTKMLLDIISMSSEESLTHIRQNITTAEDLLTRLECDPQYLNTLEWGVEQTLISLVNRAKVDLAISEGGKDSLMSGFINCNSVQGKKIYGQIVEKVYEKMCSTGVPCSLVFVDLDDFRRVNKQISQEAGDLAIAHSANIISEVLRSKKGDRQVRYGGEEIGLLMENTTQMQAIVPAERIRSTLESNPLLLRRYIGPDNGGVNSQEMGGLDPISPERFEQLVKKNGILSIEKWSQMKIPEHLKQLLEGKRIVESDKVRGVKIILPDERKLGAKIELLHVPITASLGVVEFSDELMEETNKKVRSVQECDNLLELSDVVIGFEISDKSAVFGDEEKNLIEALHKDFNIKDVKKTLHIGHLDNRVSINRIKDTLRMIMIKHSFNKFRGMADAEMVSAKKLGKNCISAKGFMVDAEAVAIMREIWNFI